MALLAIDAGHTAIKVALFDESGHERHAVSARAAVASPFPHWQERDMLGLWHHVADLVRACLTESGTPGSSVAAVGLCGHGDGVYLVDAAGEPVRPAVLAIDSRATDEARTLGSGATGEALLHRTGQVPFAGSPAAVLQWLARHEPATLARTRWALSCKDWLRLRLTGEVGTDHSDASASLCDVRTGQWSDDALAATGVARALLPPILQSTEIAGTVTQAAATLTGLRPGTPVATGAHDVDAAAVGTGAHRPGDLSVVLGTFCINQVVAGSPVVNRAWHTRSFALPGRWLHMSTSASGAGNVDWVAHQLGMIDAHGLPDVGTALARAESAPRRYAGSEELLYLPFLHGSPVGAATATPVGAAFIGMRAWHTRDDLLRAVMEGVVHTHRMHVDLLRSGLELSGTTRVAGGGARSAHWSGLLADALGVTVEVTDASQAVARGAALMAGVAIGTYADVEEAVTTSVQVIRRHEPGTGREALARGYRRYRRLVTALSAEDAPDGARAGGA